MTVYFIKPVGMTGPIKIGCSCAPDNRRKSLETWSPFPLEIVAEYPGEMRVERQFHAMFVGTYQSHEWFGWSPEIQATIDAIVDGSFNPATLPEAIHLPRKVRDNSYLTEGWRYRIGLHRRIGILRDRGLPWKTISEAGAHSNHVDLLAGADLQAARDRFEPLVALWSEQYPKKPAILPPAPFLHSDHRVASKEVV